jgi:hypothetical protein
MVAIPTGLPPPDRERPGIESLMYVRCAYTQCLLHIGTLRS